MVRLSPPPARAYANPGQGSPLIAVLPITRREASLPAAADPCLPYRCSAAGW
jgi:hypothetical protein